MKEFIWHARQRIRYGKIANHPSYIGDGELEHDWEFVCDWYGDPDVVNGTCDCSHVNKDSLGFLLVSVDELNAHLGVIKNFCPDIALTLEAIQLKLLDVLSITEADVSEIQASMNRVEEKYPGVGIDVVVNAEANRFYVEEHTNLPGRCKTSSFLDLAAAVCRRAEMDARTCGSNGAPVQCAIQYLDNLNFLLQAMSRGVTKERK